MAARIHEVGRVIRHVYPTVQARRIIRIARKWIAGDEPAYARVVIPGTQIEKPCPSVPLLTSEPELVLT